MKAIVALFLLAIPLAADDSALHGRWETTVENYLGTTTYGLAMMDGGRFELDVDFDWIRFGAEELGGSEELSEELPEQFVEWLEEAANRHEARRLHRPVR